MCCSTPPTFEEKGVSSSPSDTRFSCPLTHEIMQDPVVAPCCGVSYERKALLRWMKKHGKRCPNSGDCMKPEDVVPNTSLQWAILYLERSYAMGPPMCESPTSPSLRKKANTPPSAPRVQRHSVTKCDSPPVLPRSRGKVDAAPMLPRRSGCDQGDLPVTTNSLETLLDIVDDALAIVAED